MKPQSRNLYLLAVAIMALALAACSGDDGDDGADGESVIIGVLPASSASSLKVSIDGVDVSSPPVVSFRATDGNDTPVTGLKAGSGGNLRFTIATLIPGTNGDSSYWKNYVVSGNGQATYERDGTLTDLGNGRYTYTFLKDITADPAYSSSRTHRVAMQIDGFPATNPSIDFRPDGGTVTVRRDIVKTETCNSCHNELAMHGGGRIEVKYCVTCHTPATIDPESGNTVDFKVMIHKLHRGEDLPSVVNGTPYQIIGFRNSVHDYSTVVFPQDIRNCTKCHNDSDPTNAPQGNNWQTQLSLQVCGSCHDDIDFDTTDASGEPVPHPGGNVNNNAECVTCHATGRFAGSVAESHALPVNVATTKFKFNILQVCGVDPSVADPNCTGAPTVKISVSDPTGATTHGYGNLYDIAGPTNGDRDPEFGAGATLNVLSAWDSSDYTNDGGTGSRPSRANSMSVLTNATDNLDGTFDMTLAALPVTSGSGAVAIEGHPRGETVIDSGNFNISVPVRGEVAYFGINGDPMVERRVAVDIVNKCDNCHRQLSLHGANRADNAQLCVMCHNPRGTDIGRRDTNSDGIPDVSGLDNKREESIDFKRLIHAIHAGQRDDPITPAVEGHGFREKGIVVYGFGNRSHDYSHVRFPGILNDCTTCHNTGTYELDGKWASPLQNGILASTIKAAPTAATAGDFTTQRGNQSDDRYTTPTAAVCSACHDSALAKAHMEFIGGAKFEVDQAAITASFETCSVCHGPDRIADLNLVHGIE